MTKKHFIALADVLKALMPQEICGQCRKRPAMARGGFGTPYCGTCKPDSAQPLTLIHIDTITNALADFCQSQNACFNRSRWLGYIAGENGPNGGAR